ncbi:MAG: response regulator [Planctomycetales bacterium]|nr:response regulator [Planctomycetales bacterium]
MGRKLLVTDDALIIREMIKDVALEDGWEIVGEAANGQQAVEQFRALAPDVVTLDLVMPEFDGLHALRGIMEANREARVLIVSALDQTEILKQALQIGAKDFIVKPFEKARLRGALAKIAGPAAPSPVGCTTNAVGGELAS